MRIYLDHNATTPLRPEVRERWLEVQDEFPANPSSAHGSGRRARDLVDRARERVAGALGVAEGEILFTSGGTEANNLALFGAVAGIGGPPAEVAFVTTRAEHASVLAPGDVLAGRGHPVIRGDVDDAGRPLLAAVVDAASCHPRAVVSVAAANNEVGTLAPVGELVAALAGAGAVACVHTDAVQALGRVPIQLSAWGCDLASFSAHKVGGPKGVGVLWCRAGTPLVPLVHGGGQEQGLRSGTEDVAGVVAAALAIDLAVGEQGEYIAHTGSLATALWEELARTLPDARLLGPPIDAPDRLPNTLSVLFPAGGGRMLVTRLDLEGLEVSAGSACASGSLEPSHVLRAMGLDEESARGALRISLGRTTTREECARAVDILRIARGSSHAT